MYLSTDVSLIVFLSSLTPPQLELSVTSDAESMKVPLLEGKLPMEHEYDNDGGDYHHKGRCSSK